MKCPECKSRGLRPRRDRVTGKPVRAGGRHLLECPTCRATPIVTSRELRALRGLQPRLWWLPAVASGLFMLAEALMLLFRDSLFDEEAIGSGTLALFGGAAIATFLSVIVWCVHGMVEARDAKERFEYGVALVFWLAVLSAGVWMGRAVWLEERERAERTPPALPGAPAAPAVGEGG